MAQNIEEFRNSIPVGDLGIIPLQSCSELGKMSTNTSLTGEKNVKMFFTRMTKSKILIS